MKRLCVYIYVERHLESFENDGLPPMDYLIFQRSQNPKLGSEMLWFEWGGAQDMPKSWALHPAPSSACKAVSLLLNIPSLSFTGWKMGFRRQAALTSMKCTVWLGNSWHGLFSRNCLACSLIRSKRSKVRQDLSGKYLKNIGYYICLVIIN